MSGWRIFFWAMLHHPEFKYCYIISPITFRLRWTEDYNGWTLGFSLHFQSLKVYVPYSVQSAYNTAHSLPSPFDDIPF